VAGKKKEKQKALEGMKGQDPIRIQKQNLNQVNAHTLEKISRW